MFVLILIGYAFGKTLWDWLELLIVPLALALGGYWLNWAQKDRQDAIEAQRRQHDRAIAAQRARDAALLSFFDHMSQLLMDKEGTQLQQLKPSPDVRRLMTARTVSVLNDLDRDRKRTVIRYLAEAGLIADETPIISFENTDLSRMDLSGLELSKCNLANADLRGADLSGTNLRGADLSGANLSVTDDDSIVTNLRGANLSVADDLALPDQGDVTNLSGANLDSADLSPAENGTVTNLRSAILTNASLLDTNLKDAVLLYANLSDAKLTNKQGLQHELDEWTARWGDPTVQQTPPHKPELRWTKGLIQEQINQARGNETTELPNGLDRPKAWSAPSDRQELMLKEQYGGW